MKTILILALATLFIGSTVPVYAGTCNPTGTCTACKSCKNCKNCKSGGTCSVCKK